MRLPIKKCEAVFESKQALVDWLEPFEFESTMQVKIEPEKKRRSLDQNALFHMWCGELSRFILSKGNKFATPEFVKDMMKYNFLGKTKIRRANFQTGKWEDDFELVHTSKLSTGEMFHFMEQVLCWANEKGCLLTIPNDSEFMKIRTQVNQ